MFDLFQTNPAKISFSEEFLECAKEDLECSKLLYTHNHYARAVYFLQQAVEKACKAFYILFCSESFEDIKRKINHQTPKVFLEFVKKMQDIFSLAALFDETMSKISQDIPKCLENMNKLLNQQAVIRKLKTEEIQYYLEIIQN